MDRLRNVTTMPEKCHSSSSPRTTLLSFLLGHRKQIFPKKAVILWQAHMTWVARDNWAPPHTRKAPEMQRQPSVCACERGALEAVQHHKHFCNMQLEVIPTGVHLVCLRMFQEWQVFISTTPHHQSGQTHSLSAWLTRHWLFFFFQKITSTKVILTWTFHHRALFPKIRISNNTLKDFMSNKNHEWNGHRICYSNQETWERNKKLLIIMKSHRRKKV